jgi:DNA-directed RNA polymerase sigma subunit (sigma70/sigma32)
MDEQTLLREITALAKAEHRRHRLACSHTSVELGDLISEGWLASQTALANFDPKKGCQGHEEEDMGEANP